nr:PREDICTED: uncharacterized protein LOC107077672 [Lepisosteus oculatus]
MTFHCSLLVMLFCFSFLSVLGSPGFPHVRLNVSEFSCIFRKNGNNSVAMLDDNTTAQSYGDYENKTNLFPNETLMLHLCLKSDVGHCSVDVLKNGTRLECEQSSMDVILKNGTHSECRPVYELPQDLALPKSVVIYNFLKSKTVFFKCSVKTEVDLIFECRLNGTLLEDENVSLSCEVKNNAENQEHAHVCFDCGTQNRMRGFILYMVITVAAAGTVVTIALAVIFFCVKKHGHKQSDEGDPCTRPFKLEQSRTDTVVYATIRIAKATK